MDSTPVHIHWFRRDLRLHDHRALNRAVRSGLPILPLFIFDTDILDSLPDRRDRRVHFIHKRLAMIRERLQQAGSSLLVGHGRPLEVWEKILRDHDVRSVSVVRDYEPYARRRDEKLHRFFSERGIPFITCKDQVIFEMSEILNSQEEPYRVFTPYANRWRQMLGENQLRECAVHMDSFLTCAPFPLPSLSRIGFESVDETNFPPDHVDDEVIRDYAEKRDYPALAATSRLGVHLRFGTVSIRRLVQRALVLSDSFLNELVWREFFQMILFHHPESPHRAVRPEYDTIRWEENEEHFRAWCEGKTGYPLVDAGMRQLNGTGYMHNRVRMVTAGFLSKHLLIDWRKGERYFAAKLLDFDLASNVGGWQWAAGCGHDAAPYFRIFNPQRQLETYDPDRIYVRSYLPEYGTRSYPAPIVEHRAARERALERYGKALGR